MAMHESQEKKIMRALWLKSRNRQSKLNQITALLEEKSKDPDMHSVQLTELKKACELLKQAIEMQRKKEQAYSESFFKRTHLEREKYWRWY